MNYRSSTLARALMETGERAQKMSPEAAYYWARHEPRYRYIARWVERWSKVHGPSRVLDVGMGFEIGVLSRTLPGARIDCLGTYDDDRFRPGRDYTFHRVDLNDAATSPRPANVAPYDLLVCMEVIEHLYVPPDVVLRNLATWLAEGGIMIVTTPNAVWLKNRIKMVCGKNPFEPLRVDTSNMGHIREYTQRELLGAIARAGLECTFSDTRGLYRFNNAKDNAYSALADVLFPSLRRTLVAIVCAAA